jgi:type II secretory pathway component PulK
MSRRRPTRRAFATVLVLIVAAIASVLLVALQTSAWRGAAAGREAVSYVRAKWAARAGVEAIIARLAAATLEPDQSSATALNADLAAVATDPALRALRDATFSITHWDGERLADGPADAHAKLNVNWMTREALLLIPNMTEDVADAILDWIDADDEPRLLGAESSYYLSLPAPYEARNGPVRHLQELELVSGLRPDLLRGEDWNLNGDLDDDEDGAEPPPGSGLVPSADGLLNAGWSAYLTAASVDGGYAASGQPRLDLATASSEDIVRRIGVTSEQADVIRDHVASDSAATLADFLTTDLATMAQQTQAATGQGLFGRARARVPALTPEQLAALFNECTTDDPAAPPRPGKLNVNVCPAETLQYLPGIDSGLADSIVAERRARPGGFTSVTDLLAVPAMTADRLAELIPYLDVRSNVFVVNSRGRDAATGMEVVITATVDRSTLPVTIKEMLIR